MIDDILNGIEKPDLNKINEIKESIKKEIGNQEQVAEDIEVKVEKEIQQSYETKSFISPSQTSMFNMILDSMEPETLSKFSETELATLNKEVNKLERSELGCIRLCNSDTCKQKELCPFNRVKKFPSGQLCPVELAIATYAKNEYYRILESELETTTFNLIEISTIQALIEIEIEEFRARVFGSIDGQIVTAPIFSTKDGEIVYGNVENPIYNLREKIDKKKGRLLQRLLLSPESKARFKVEDKGKNKKSTKDLITSAESKIKELRNKIPGNR